MALDVVPHEDGAGHGAPSPGVPVVTIRASRAGVGTRFLSLVALSGVISGFAYGGSEAYHALRDSFVAPIILSPDNDLVIQSKLSLSRVTAERQTIAARMEQDRGATLAAEAAVRRLESLRTQASRALEWSRAVADGQASLGESELGRVADQKVEVERMIAKQEAYVAELQRNLAAGLIHKSDVAREENALSEMRMAALQNQRDRLQVESELQKASLAQEVLRNTGGGTRRMATPEMMAQRDQLVRIELELLKLRAELNAKTVQARVDAEELAAADELIAQMKSRPIFRAIEASQNVAFVPYTQIEGVREGADVYRCAVWGVFGCSPVGRVAALLPGEVAMQDPWGQPARGQYLLLTLSDPAAAQAKTLRVREAADAPVTATPLPDAGAARAALSRR